MFHKKTAQHESRSSHGRIPSSAPMAGLSAVKAGAVAVGAAAVGALAIGALAIGALAICRLRIGKARIRRLEVDELVVGRFEVREKAGEGQGRGTLWL